MVYARPTGMTIKEGLAFVQLGLAGESREFVEGKRRNGALSQAIHGDLQ